MSRTLRDTKLESRAAREKLRARGKPYWRELEPGCHLGYRRLSGKPGRWVARHYIGAQSYQTETIATADDYSDADGVAVLSYRQAQAKIRERMVERAHAADPDAGPYSVSKACDDYLDYLRSEGRSDAAIKDATYRVEAFIRPALGALEVMKLRASQLRRWRADLAKAAPRLRTKVGSKQKHREQSDDRARKATANRHLTVLKAALNHAFDEEKVPANQAWGRRVKPFEDVETARIRYLQIAEARRLVNACDASFGLMVQAALQTGARYSELARVKVDDFDRDAGTVFIGLSKGGKARHVALSDEGVQFFRQACAGLAGNTLIFRKSDGSVWSKSHQDRPMARACKRASITPKIGFHGLRHTYASLMVKSGAPLHVVALNLGHVSKDGQPDVRMVTRHYAHFEESFVAAAVKKHAPRFGFKVDKKVVTLAGKV
jgi:integrase